MLKNLIVLLGCFMIYIPSSKGIIFDPPSKDDIVQKQIIMRTDDVCYYGWADYPSSLKLNNTSDVETKKILFPDSTVFVETNSGVERTDVHAISYTFDMVPFYGRASFQADSISLKYNYQRKLADPSIVDTVVFYLFSNKSSTSFTTEGINFNSNPITIYRVPYNEDQDIPNVSEPLVIKVPLTNSDVTSEFGDKALKVYLNNFQVGNYSGVSDTAIAGVVVKFVPGYTYSPGDTITKSRNYFSYYSLEENRPDTYPNEPHYYSGFNSSGELSTASKYFDGGKYVTSFEQPRAFGREHHFISFFAQSCLASTNEDRFLERDVTVFPNPTSDRLTLKAAKKTEMEITIVDQTGRIVEKKFITLNPEKRIDVSNYQIGEYILVGKTEEKAMTVKFSVVNK